MRSNEWKLYGLSGLGVLLGSVGVALTSASFRKAIADTFAAIGEGQRRFDHWNDAAQAELLRVQQSLQELRATIQEMQSPDALEQF